MSLEDSQYWDKVYRAQEKLIREFLDHPDVSLIDIGYAPDQGTGTELIVMRIHVRKRWMETNAEDRITFPEQVDDIPVFVIPGDYRLAKR